MRRSDLRLLIIIISSSRRIRSGTAVVTDWMVLNEPLALRCLCTALLLWNVRQGEGTQYLQFPFGTREQ